MSRVFSLSVMLRFPPSILFIVFFPFVSYNLTVFLSTYSTVEPYHSRTLIATFVIATVLLPPLFCTMSVVTSQTHPFVHSVLVSDLLKSPQVSKYYASSFLAYVCVHSRIVSRCLLLLTSYGSASSALNTYAQSQHRFVHRPDLELPHAMRVPES